MEAYVQVLMFAIPGFLLLIGIEYGASVLMKKPVYRGYDTVTSLSSGLTNVIKDVMGLTIVIISYGWLVEHLALFEIESKVWMFVVAFIGKDFAGYWSHRLEHVINLFWNRHIIHHSSEEFNLACALRQPVSNLIALFTIFYLPVAIIGVPTIVVATVAPLHLFAQFWYHTRLIDKLGPIEYILVTPSHHRVHHAINDQYIDKNYSQIFIFWDHLFGTFQAELNEVPPVFGVKRPVNTWNPIVINFRHLWLLVKDAWHTKSWVDKARIWFMPTGWRPEGLDSTHPEYSISDVYNFKKYDTPKSFPLLIWVTFQVVFHMLLALHLFKSIASYDFSYVLLYTCFLFCSIFAYGSLMDRSVLALIFELLKLAIASFLLWNLNSWFGLETMIAGATNLLIVYFVVSLLITVYFLYFEKNSPLRSGNKELIA